MATYITLLRFTQKGIENIKESPSRLDAARKAFSAAGAELKTFYLATGQYDAVAISEAPNDEAIVKAAITTASKEASAPRPSASSPRTSIARSSLPCREQ